MLTDYHTHTYRCGHAVGTMDEYIESAIARGIGEIGLSDHLYLYFLDAEKRPRQWAIVEEEYDVHYAEMLAARERYRGRINVRVAVEMDYVQGFEAPLETILSRYQYDYILGSVHFMDGWLIDVEDNVFRYREQRVAEIYRRYFANVQRLARLGVADLLAHLDLPKKFGFLPEDDVTDIVSETLDVIADAGVAVEVSTGGLRKPIAEIYPSETILRAMKARNIPIALSSDAHAPAEIGAHYDQSVTFVRSVGYEELVTFEKRRASPAPIG